MVVVDTHCHASPYWFEPIETLLDQMVRSGVDKAALIQFRGVFDNSYLIESMRRFPGRFSVVAIVDTDRPDATEVLEDWVRQGAEGVRLAPTTRSPGSDPLAIWRKAADLGIVVSSLGSVEEFASAEFQDVIKTLPNLNIIIEYLGGAGGDLTPPHSSYRQVLALAKYPNTFMKIPGLGEICPRPMPFIQPMPFPDIPPLIEMAIESFGAQRLMWGSDFPPSAAREGYGNTLRFPMEFVKFNSEEDKEWIFGKTATNHSLEIPLDGLLRFIELLGA
jgi:L-fuconolactonase